MTSFESNFEGAGRLTETGDAVDAFNAPDITPEKYAEHLANLTANALTATKLVDLVLEVKAGIGQIHLLLRISKVNERKFLETVVEPILHLFERDEDGNGFIGKQFLLKDNEVKYAWVVSFASNDLKDTVTRVCASFDSAILKMEVTESPLIGAGAPQSGGHGSGRRGASPVM